MSIYRFEKKVLWECVVVLAMCVSMLAAEPECKEAPKAMEAVKEAPPADPYADAQILVEAFVVEVSTEGLKALGVSPLGQTPDGISIAKLTECLMQGKDAKVISGAKVTAKQNEPGTAKEEKTIYHKYARQYPGGSSVMDVSFHDFRLNKQLSAKPIIESCNLVSVEYSYQENGVQFDPNEDPNCPVPPTQYTYCWNGRLSLQPGKPNIAAAVQNKGNVVFLVLTATIQDASTPAAEEKK